jgi:hypothetical protein
VTSSLSIAPPACSVASRSRFGERALELGDAPVADLGRALQVALAGRRAPPRYGLVELGLEALQVAR